MQVRFEHLVSEDSNQFHSPRGTLRKCSHYSGTQGSPGEAAGGTGVAPRKALPHETLG